ncbi:flippase, partial [Candidatus Falkowbacteria bacterium]|nr:flippase [Candidatus Falkowbacteria bacterium]
MAQPNLTKNTTYYTGALTVQKILAFIYFWFISNNLFPGQLGQYVFALSFATLFSIFVDLGLSPILTREAAKRKTEANRYLKNIIGLKIPLAFIAIAVAWAVINLTGKSDEIKLLVYLASFIMILDSFSLSFWVIFRARQNLKYESIATILVQLIIFILGILALKTTGRVAFLILALLAASIFNFLLSLALLKIKLKFSLKPRLDPETVGYFLKIMPAFALAGVFIKIYNTSDSILLSYLASDEAVGFFAVPAKVIYAFQQIIPAAFAAVIFPAFSYYYANAKNLLDQTFNKAFSYLTIISLPIAGGIIVTLPEIISLLWPGYRPVIPTFFIMALAIPFIFLAILYFIGTMDLSSLPKQQVYQPVFQIK